MADDDRYFDGELLVSSLGNRAAAFCRQRTGVHGSVEQTPAGPRIVLAG